MVVLSLFESMSYATDMYSQKHQSTTVIQFNTMAQNKVKQNTQNILILKNCIFQSLMQFINYHW